MSERDSRVLIVGHDAGPGFGAAMAALVSADIAGLQIIALEDHPHRDSRLHDRLDILGMIARDEPRAYRRAPDTDRGRVITSMFAGLSGSVRHIDTPKPISKRKARRLRGKGAA